MKNILSYSLFLIFALVFIACESNFREVQKMSISEFKPSGEADSINLKYTDSGRITAVLKSEKMLDFSMVEFPYTEFPKGIFLTLYDAKGMRTYVRSNYAISYKNTSLIDLQGKVTISTDNNEQLETEQLYYDQKNDWFFTEKRFKLTSSKGVSNGEGIDFSKDFKRINSQKISGQINETE
jgi:LPS export ABC transporter protein LptC